MIRLIAASAAAAVLGAGAHASSDSVFVTGSVAEFVEIVATTDTIAVTLAADGAVDMAGQEGNRALFTIRANTNWNLVADPGATFIDPRGNGFNQVSYVNTSANETIGGSFFIDPTPGVQVPGDADLIRYSSAAQNVTTSGGPGEFNWGLGGAIDTAITPAEFVADRIAAAGDYTAEIVITVTAAP